MIALGKEPQAPRRRPPVGAGDQPLFICLVTETFGTDINGVAMTLGRLVDGLRACGHHVQVVRTRRATDRNGATGDLVRPGQCFPGYPEVCFGLPCGTMLRAAWRQRPPDLIHIATEGPLGLSALGAARDGSIPVVTTFHTNFQTYARHYHLRWMEGAVDRYLRWFHNRTQATLVPTRSLAAELDQRGFHRLGVMSRGIDTALFHPHRRREDLRRTWGLAADDLALLYVGRLAAEKNLGLAIRAFEVIREDHPQARLVLVGDGPARSQVVGLPGVVWQGYRRGEDLAAHYASADAFLFPSTTETYGNVLVEAMAARLPVVAFDYAAAHERVVDGLNGLVVPIHDDRAFIVACQRLLARPPVARQALGAAARASVLSLSWPAIIEDYLARVRPLVRRHQAARTTGDTR